MNFKKLLDSITGIQGVIIKTKFNNEILFTGSASTVLRELMNKGWLVHEVKLSDPNNYNSDYILTIY